MPCSPAAASLHVKNTQSRLPSLRAQFPWLSYQSRPVSNRVGPAINLVLLLLIGVAYVLESTHFVNAQTLRKAESDQYPRAAIAYMRTHALPSHVFASYSWGGYLLWNVFPRYRDYMDSRADTLFNNAILRDYLTMYAGKPGWQSVLQQRRVDLVLVERTAPLSQLLALDPSWKLLFHDRLSVLYERRTTAAGRA